MEVTAKAAAARGEPHYFTGKPCRRGHVAWRYTINGSCSKCASLNSLKSIAKKADHPAQAIARASGERHFSTGKPCKNGHLGPRYTTTGVCVACEKANHKRWIAAHPGEEARWARERRAKNHQRRNKRPWKHPIALQLMQQKQEEPRFRGMDDTQRFRLSASNHLSFRR